MSDSLRLPVCHPPVSFVWRPTRHEPFRPYSCCAWFVPDQVAWQGREFYEAAAFASRVNRLHGFGTEPPPPPPEPPRRWSLAGMLDMVRRLGRREAPAAAPVLRRGPLPQHVVKPLRRPSPVALVSLVRQFQRHNAPPLPELLDEGWVAEDRLTPAGHYVMSRAIVEAPTPFLSCLFSDIPAALDKHNALMGVASSALEAVSTVRLLALPAPEPERLSPLQRLRLPTSLDPVLLCAVG